MDAERLTTTTIRIHGAALLRAAFGPYIPIMTVDPARMSGLQAERLPAMASPLPHVRIAELDRVTLGRDVEGDDGEKVPAGASGTVVGIWAGGAAFEVEFAEPVSALATVAAAAIASHTPR